MSESKRIKSIVYTCQHCGKEYHPKEKTRNKYCSRECFFADIAVSPKPHNNPACIVCGKEFEGRPNAKYCSDECKKERERRRSKKFWSEYKAAAIVNEHITKACKWCGKEYTTNFMANSRYFCSDVCAKRHGKLQAKSRKRGIFIEPVSFADIYKRDKGICQICGEPVDLSVKTSNRMGATLDHRIPLSKGGTHEPNNVQLAHRICNALKSDRLA